MTSLSISAKLCPEDNIIADKGGSQAQLYTVIVWLKCKYVINFCPLDMLAVS